MSKTEAWIEELLINAKQGNTLVTDVTVEKIRKLLESQLCERQLSSKELEKTAKELLADMPKEGA